MKKYLLSAILLWGVTTVSLHAKSTKSFVGPANPSRDGTGREGRADIKQSKGVPHEINYQGWLGDPSDTTGITGAFGMTFRMYDAKISGTLLWDESHPNVTVDKGIFNVLLGSQDPIPSNIFTGDQLWLETQVSTDTLSPRKKLVSVGYAIKSKEADHAIHSDTAGYASFSAGDNDWTISGSKLYAQDTSWRVGIGTTSPFADARLHVNANGAKYGVAGNGSAGKFAGVYGEANGAWHGVFGLGSTGRTAGVFGKASGATYGVYALGSTGKIAGMYSEANGATYGVYALGSTGTGKIAGVRGDAGGADYGVYGMGSAEKMAGVYGNAGGAEYGVAGLGSAEKMAGVYGADGGATYGVYYTGGLGGTGKKSTVVRASKGPTEMYCIEATELWFEDFGTGRLVNGQAQIDLDQDFIETVTIDANNPMKVFIQLKDNCNGVYVKTELTGFEVVELGSGTSNAIFDYRIVAKRKSYETQRMKVVESCYIDKLLYPDDNDPAIPLKWREIRQKQSEAEKRAKEAGTK